MTRGGKGTISTLGAVSLLLQVATVQAQGRSYDELIGEAISEYQQGHWEEARSLFRKAHVLEPNARTLRGLGVIEFELRHYVQSVRLLTAALNESRDALTPELRAEVQEVLERATTFIGRYSVELRPPTASLRVDGMRPQFEPDGSLLLDAGEHRLVAEVPGRPTLSRDLDVTGGENERLVLDLSVAAGSVDHKRDDTDVEDDGNMLQSPWFWVAAGAVAVAGGAALVLATGGDDPPAAYGGTTGVVLRGP